MGIFNKAVGHADIGDEVKAVEEYLSEGEQVIQTFKFVRDSIVLTNLGIYMIDVQGMSGKKVEVKFYPKKTIKTITFETAGPLDVDVDIKIGVDNNPTVLELGGVMSAPIEFKVQSGQSAQAKEIVRLIKENYLI